jgi:sugar (pentulose or hexulose) kinase
MPSRIGFVGDVIVARLCGRSAQDGTSAALTLLYDPTQRRYDPGLLARLGLAEAQLPDLLSPREPAGLLLPEVARMTGLPSQIPVSAAIHDQYTAALAAGVVRAGTVMVGTGTAWVLLAVGDKPVPPVTDDAYACHHVVEELHGQILSLVNGGSALTWALELTGQQEREALEIERLLESVPPGCAGLRCWPFLATSGVAGLGPEARGQLSGLQLSHQPGHVIRAVVEGLAFELKRHLDFLKSWLVSRLVLTGGAAQGHVTGLPLACAGADAGSPLGAAIIARGLLAPAESLADLAESMAPSVRWIEPGPDAAFYQERYQRYVDSLPMLS